MKRTRRHDRVEGVMSDVERTALYRRQFLRFLAGAGLSSLLPLGTTGCGDDKYFLQEVAGSPAVPLDPPAPAASTTGNLVPTAADAYNVFDLRAVAGENIPLAHWGYLESGVEGDVTLRRNEAAFNEILLKPRRLVDVSRISLGVNVFGENLSAPFVLCPVGSQMAFHPDGELAVARAARRLGFTQCLSSVSSTALEAVNAELGRPVWFQLYPTTDRNVTAFVVNRAMAAGCKVLLLTVDNISRRSDTSRLYAAMDTRDCTVCHAGKSWRDKPLYEGSGVTSSTGFVPLNWDWSYLTFLKGLVGTNMKIVVKGIVTAADAQQCRASGVVDGVFVSNHGGRGEESGRATIESLPEVVAALAGSGIQIVLDSGIRRGGDIFKALALGADAVGIGRPYVWGLGAFGQEGVEAAINILRSDLITTMRAAGVARVADIDGSYLY